MTTNRTTIIAALLAAAALLPHAAQAQAQVPPPDGQNGPLVFEPINPGFSVAPDYKLTSLDGNVANLLGFRAGWTQQDTLFIGGEWHWMVGGSHDEELTYGGLTLGWTTPPAHRVQVGGRGLVGFGHGALLTDYTVPIHGGHDFRNYSPGMLGTVRADVHEDFFVFEPMVDAGAAINRNLRLTFGAGYRIAGAVDVLGDRLNGATGSLGLQIRFN